MASQTQISFASGLISGSPPHLWVYNVSLTHNSQTSPGQPHSVTSHRPSAGRQPRASHRNSRPFLAAVQSFHRRVGLDELSAMESTRPMGDRWQCGSQMGPRLSEGSLSNARPPAPQLPSRAGGGGGGTRATAHGRAAVGQPVRGGGGGRGGGRRRCRGPTAGLGRGGRAATFAA